MQLARLRFHLHTRTLQRKCAQILRALEIERHYSKSQILEAYLNLAPYGRNIEGVGAASRDLFRQGGRRFTGHEAIALSVIPQSPTRRALFVDRRCNRSLNSAQNTSTPAYTDKRGPSFQIIFRPRAERKHDSRPALSSTEILEDVKDASSDCHHVRSGKQRLIERRIADYVAANADARNPKRRGAGRRFPNHGRPCPGRFGRLWQRYISGQVDGTRSARSPGFGPETVRLCAGHGTGPDSSACRSLADAPHSFGEYNPENFDREFLGPIQSERRAWLAVAIFLRSCSRRSSRIRRSTNFLEKCRRDAPARRNHFTGSRCLSVARKFRWRTWFALYAALANDGELLPLRRLRDDPALPERRRILSPRSRVSYARDARHTCRDRR